LLQTLADDELIESFRQGDISAFNLLAWRWQKPILNFLTRLAGSVPEAEDLTQQTFLKVYQKLPRLREPQKFSSWLYQIALNLAKDHLRHKRKRRFVSFNRTIDKMNEEEMELDQVLADPNARTPEQILDQRQLQAILNRCLQEISVEQRIIILLRFYQGLKFREIAEILHIPDETAKWRFYSGLKALRIVLNCNGLTREVWHP